MDKHSCKQCGKIFKYCGACSFKTIYYHEEGFCSDECCTEYRLGLAKKEAEPVVIEELVAPVEEPKVEEPVVVEQPIEVPEKEIPKKMSYSGKKWNTQVVK